MVSRSKTLKYVLAHELTKLYMLAMTLLRRGEMSFEQIKWFLNLTYEERAKLLANAPEITIPWFLSELNVGGRSDDVLFKEIEKTHSLTYEKGMNFPALSKAKKLKVKLITPRHLKLSAPPKFSEWLKLLEEHNTYDILPAEAGPNTYLQYPEDQTEMIRIHIAMKTIPAEGGNPCVFCTGKDKDGKWFNARWFHPEREVDLDTLWLVKERE